MAAVNRIILPYTPRDAFKPYHNSDKRFFVGVAHRRCGKTVATINNKIKRAVSTTKPNYRAAYIAPYFNQAKDIAWQYLKRYAEPLLARVNEGELYVELVNGARIRIYGADNPDRLRGGYLDDVTLDEYADMYPGIWGTVIRPMLADRLGTASFIGTPKGKNAFYDLYDRAGSHPDWGRFILRASETNILQQSELDAARLDMTEEQYEQEFECSFDAAIVGAYFGKQMAKADRDGRLVADLKPIDGPIHCAWDFGNGLNMAIWAFQVSPSGPRVLDFIQISGYYFEDYIQEVKRRGYNGADYVPHDARVPSFETGRTRIETMLAMGRKPQIVGDYSVDDGINAAKMTIGVSTFNSTATAHGLEALRQYQQEYDEKARVFKTTPKHNWASHPADAFRYLALAWRMLLKSETQEPKPLFKPLNEITYDEYLDFSRTDTIEGTRV